jgi:hypothetical protein
MSDAELFLRDQVPPKTQALIASTFKTAYDAAKKEIERSPILSVRSAEDNHGRIIAWAIDHEVEKLINRRQWACACHWAPFTRPTGYYLEILLSHSVLTISQIDDPSQQPRDVIFRANKRLSNEQYFDLPEFEIERQVIGLPHILLIHGYQALTFVHLAIPNERHSAGYIYKTPNLLDLPHEVLPSSEDRPPQPPPEQTDNDPIITLKEEIDKWRRENGE